MRSYYAYMHICQVPVALEDRPSGVTGMTPDAPDWLRGYPAHLSRTWTLASGQSLCLRPVRHDDGELEEAFVRGLSLESGYQRLLTGGTKVTPEWIDSMTH